jgi:hypothetical protein
MKIFFKENWFKLGILIILIIAVMGVISYLHNKNVLAEQERVDRIANEEKIKVEKERIRIEQEQVQQLENEKKEEQKQAVAQTVAVKNTRIASQIVEFENVLEGKLIDADVSCLVFATYNNLSVVNPNLLSEALPDSKETYEKKCLNAIVPLNLLRNKLVAEPELQELRKMLTDYIDTVRGLSTYALDGGYSAKVIDKYSADVEKIRVSAREELLRVQRQYNVKPQYVSR